jgi:hypothetical protein
MDDLGLEIPPRVTVQIGIDREVDVEITQLMRRSSPLSTVMALAHSTSKSLLGKSDQRYASWTLAKPTRKNT